MNQPARPKSSSSSSQESSILFSLDELLGLEQERIQVEEQAERARLREEARRKEEEIEARWREEEARRHAAEEKRRAEELTKREEAARLEAIGLAALEKARRQAESDARLRLLAQEQDHEQRLAALEQDRSKKRLRTVALVTAGLCLGSLVFGYALVQRSEQQAKMERSVLEREAAELRTQKEREIELLKREKDRLGEEDQRERKELEERLRILRDQLDSAPKMAPRGPGSRGGTNRPISPPSPPPSDVCEKGDPMCETLGR